MSNEPTEVQRHSPAGGPAYDADMARATPSKKPLIAAAESANDEVGSDPAALVLRRFRVVFNAVKTHFRQVEKRTGVGGAQLWALSLIREHPGIGVGELAQSMDIHQSTASNLVRGLVTRALVQANREGADRRAVQLSLLPAGTSLLKKAPAPLSGVLPLALASLDARTLKRLDADLAKVVAALNADDRGANIPLGQ